MNCCRWWHFSEALPGPNNLSNQARSLELSVNLLGDDTFKPRRDRDLPGGKSQEGPVEQLIVVRQREAAVTPSSLQGPRKVIDFLLCSAMCRLRYLGCWPLDAIQVLKMSLMIIRYLIERHDTVTGRFPDTRR